MLPLASFSIWDNDDDDEDDDCDDDEDDDFDDNEDDDDDEDGAVLCCLLEMAAGFVCNLGEFPAEKRSGNLNCIFCRYIETMRWEMNESET